MNFLFFALAGLLAHADGSYTLKGSIAGLDKGWVYLNHLGTTPKTDSLLVQNGKFSFSGTIAEPELCVLGLRAGAIRQNSPYFFLSNGDLTLTAKKDAFSSALISGTSTQAEFRQLDSIEAGLKADSQQKQTAKTFVRTHSSSYVSAFALLNYFSYNVDDKELDSLMTGLDPAVRNSYLGQQVDEVLRGAKLTAIGKSAPGFTQKDVDGKEIMLSSFQGNYVLIDFWASWCGPCRLENPNVVKAYNRYHGKGFAIIGVSLDNQKDKWMAAIQKDGLHWTQVSDLKGWDNQVATIYGIKGIPINFLLDKEGKVVAKGLMGEALEKKLAELLP